MFIKKVRHDLPKFIKIYLLIIVGIELFYDFLEALNKFFALSDSKSLDYFLESNFSVAIFIKEIKRIHELVFRIGSTAGKHRRKELFIFYSTCIFEPRRQRMEKYFFNFIMADIVFLVTEQLRESILQLIYTELTILVCIESLKYLYVFRSFSFRNRMRCKKSQDCFLECILLSIFQEIIVRESQILRVYCGCVVEL